MNMWALLLCPIKDTFLHAVLSVSSRLSQAEPVQTQLKSNATHSCAVWGNIGVAVGILQKNCQSSTSRAYRPAEGGERACNSHTASTEGEMLAVTKNTLAVSL